MLISNPSRHARKAWCAATAIALALSAMMPATAYAQNAIESVTSAPQGASTQVRIKLKDALAAPPQGFSINNPPKVALDLTNVDNATGSGSTEFAQGDARSMNIVQVGGRSRVVLNLRRPATYTSAMEGNTLVVTLTPVAAPSVVAAASALETAAAPTAASLATPKAAPTPIATVPVVAPVAVPNLPVVAPVIEKKAVAKLAAAPVAAPLPSNQAVANVPKVAIAPNEPALRDVDFRRGQNGEGRVVVDLSDPQIAVDIRQQGQTVVVDFLRSKLPANLRRRMDVADFGTPVKAVKTSQVGDLVRMVIEPQGLWEHNAYQSENQFVLEVKAIKEDPNKLFQGTRLGYRGDKLSLNFQSVDVRSLLQVIADFTNLNIVTSDSVAGSLTLRLKDVPWDQALDIIMQSKGLDMRKNGNVILVAPREELATKEKLELEARAQISDIEPLRTEVFQLNYQKAEMFGKLLTDDKQRVLSKRGSAVIDARTNKIFVQDIGGRLDEVRKLIAQTDVAVRQVLIEARIVEADDRFSRNLGARLGLKDLSSTQYRPVAVTDPVSGQSTALNVPIYGAGTRLGGSTYGAVGGNITGVQDATAQNGTDISGTNAVGLGRSTALNNQLFVNMPANGIGGVSAGSIAFSLFGAGLTKFLNLEISALEADQRGKVVSSPRVLAFDQSKAVIEQGTELPFQTATSSGATAITFRKANLKLEVTPQITPEGSVIMDVAVNRDSVGQLTSAGFAIDTRAVRTQVLVENGGTVVIGGIYEQFERNSVSKVPLLGDIPIVGNLFKTQQRTADKTELLVFLTPRIVTDTAVAR